MTEPILKAESLVKDYRMGAARLRVLHGVDLAVGAGEFLCILGPSGSGKSTLLHLLGLLDRPTSGRVVLDGQDAFARPKRWRDRMRNSFVGFVFQFYYLMPDLSVLGNTMLPAMIRTPLVAWPGARGRSRRRALKVLGDLGLAERVAHLPRELSGGERQRAALARALVHEPRILFADEPTGNLDSATGEEIMRVVTRLNRRDGLTVVVVTHDQRVAEQADRVLHLADGKLLRGA
ncbi:MAG TPA: ABC transporter ATP-binding protein [Phycisphaerae bacterium]|nr:ABC transporter ATP-binding protein [Phycisphaerae bacterium]